MLERAKPKTLRCAIYTRKSSEEGLEQDFNSLHAQREACEAFVTSQRHEGWKALPTAYDDGGFSGGSMERPALQRLLADIASGGIDVVVVYKVDRLTRSLADFAKMVEVFDARGVSFVSVTQQFNTTTSMGRLTLNVLLSFAQFEREVTGERIRDKIAASKKKGMWMGGWVPIGYDRKDRSLTLNEAEAETVRTIFRLYLKHKNVRATQAELERLGLTTKRYVAASGRTMGGLSFRRGHIYHILSNPLYVGEIGHRGARHAGQHPAIIDRETWDAVQAQLRTNGHDKRTRAHAKERSLLAGLLFDEAGRRFTASHTVKDGKRYRYYALGPSTGRAAPKRPTGPTLSVPAPEIEGIIVGQVAGFLKDSSRLLAATDLAGSPTASVSHAVSSAKQLATDLEQGSASQHDLLGDLIHRIVVSQGTLQIELDREFLVTRLSGRTISAEAGGDEERPPILIDMALRAYRRGAGTKLVVEDSGCVDPAANPDPALIKAVARGHVWFDELLAGRADSITEIAAREGVTDRYVSQLIGLAFTPPKLVEAILEGRQRPEITLKRLLKESDSHDAHSVANGR